MEYWQQNKHKLVFFLRFSRKKKISHSHPEKILPNLGFSLLRLKGRTFAYKKFFRFKHNFNTTNSKERERRREREK